MANAHPLLNKCDDYYQRLIDWEQTRAAIKGKNEVLKIITRLPSPMYSDYSKCATSKDPEVQKIHTQQALANNARLAAYWSRGRYYNASGRTHTSLQGMLWSKPPEVEYSPQIQYMETNCNGGNLSLNDFVKDLTSDILSAGRYGVLVDMPQSMDGARPTVEEVENGFSARLIAYKAEQIFFWRIDARTNSLAEVRLTEFKEIQKTEFEFELEEYTRRLVLIDGVYTNELYDEKCELVEATQPKASSSTLNYIPFQFFNAGSNSPETDNPPLYDLCQMNLGHFVLDCDNRDNLHYHGQGMTNIFTELSPEEFTQRNPAGLDVGAKGRNMFGKDDKVEVLQIAATGAIPEEMIRDEHRMVALGAQTTQDVNTNVTLGAKELEFGASVSQLKQISYNTSDGVTQCLVWADLFMGGSGENVSYSQNSDFVTDSLTPEMLNHYFTAVQSGKLPDVIYYEALRSAGATKLEDDEIRDLANEQAMDMQGESEELANLRAENESLRGESE